MNALNPGQQFVVAPHDIDDAVAMLAVVLDWLDKSDLSFPAIDVNSAIERLKSAQSSQQLD